MQPPDRTRVNWPVDASASGSAQVGATDEPREFRLARSQQDKRLERAIPLTTHLCYGVMFRDTSFNFKKIYTNLTMQEFVVTQERIWGCETSFVDILFLEIPFLKVQMKISQHWFPTRMCIKLQWVKLSSIELEFEFASNPGARPLTYWHNVLYMQSRTRWSNNTFRRMTFGFIQMESASHA